MPSPPKPDAAADRERSALQPGKPNYATLADKVDAVDPVFEKSFPGKSLE